jgi:four helix bundle protein
MGDGRWEIGDGRWEIGDGRSTIGGCGGTLKSKGVGRRSAPRRKTMRWEIDCSRTPELLAISWRMFPLERLDVYQQATALARESARDCASLSDIDLRRQLLRAIRSIAANLAEGSGSDSQAVFARHIAIALGSAKESECHLQIARDAGLIDASIHANLQLALDNLRPRLIRLLAAVRRNARRRSD